uniref:Uncharacterized protein n=1 Tax=Helianthus annuus TaxID=4232 RepID=A0A251TF43_HELAN
MTLSQRQQSFPTHDDNKSCKPLMLKASHRAIYIASPQTSICGCNHNNSYNNKLEPQTPLIPHY